jgi:hypothetical protein
MFKQTKWYADNKGRDGTSQETYKTLQINELKFLKIDRDRPLLTAGPTSWYA